MSIRERNDPLCDRSPPGTAWSTKNISEALPGVLTASTWSLWSDAAEGGIRQAYAALGLLRSADTSVAPVTMGAFFGRPAINVDAVRFYAERAPGTSGDAIEEQLLGFVRDDPPDFPDEWRLPFVLARLPRAVALEPRRVRAFVVEQHRWWRNATAKPASNPRALLRQAAERLEAAHRHHSVCSMLAMASLDQLAAVAASAERPELHTRLSTGLGSLQEQLFIEALWGLARGETTLAAVLAEFGFHGPGELSQPSYREDPGALEQVAERYRELPPEQEPGQVLERQAANRAEALRELLAALPVTRRLLARCAVRFAAAYVPIRETGKVGYLMALDAARAAIDDIGRALVRQGRLETRRDAFNLTLAELLGPAEDFHVLVAERRARRDEYSRLDLPVSWIGQPEPRPGDEPPSPDGGTRLTGIGVFPGIVEAAARVAITVDEAVLVEQDEVLICPMTDPSWASVFPLTGALAIDIGSQASHGALVARELGIPCVINTRVGTRMIRTGDLVRLDGEAGTVELVRPNGAGEAA